MDENQENVQPNEQKKFNICALLSFILSLVGLSFTMWNSFCYIRNCWACNF